MRVNNALIKAAKPERVWAYFNNDRGGHAPRDAVRLGIGLLTEDRKADGLLLPLSVAANVTLADNVEKVSRLLDKIVAGRGEKQDVDNVHQIARQMEMKTICALADGAAMPAKSYIEKFRADFDALVRG